MPGIDRWCVIAVHQEREWQALCQATNHLEWLGKDEFSTLERRVENRVHLDSLIEEWTHQRASEEVADILQKAGVPVGIVQDMKDLDEDPHLRFRQFFHPLAHPNFGEIIADRSP